jgi:glutaredoxin-like protein NrdH
MDANRDLQTHLLGTQAGPERAVPDLWQVVREPSVHTTADTLGHRAKRPSIHRLPVRGDNRPAQTRIPANDPKRQGQITIEGIAYQTVDISLDAEARSYVMALGHLQAPVVVAGNDHWSGFRPDRIKTLATAA